MDMLTDIEQGALDLLTTKIEGIRAAGIQKDARTLFVAPSIACACLDGDMEKITNVTWKQNVILSVLITFKDLQGEEKRRKGVNPIVTAVIQFLLLQDFGLDIKRLAPLRFRDVTTTDDYTEGKIRYLVQFATSYTITKQSDEEVTDLLTIGLNYYLKPGDEIVDATDTVTLSQ